MALWRVCVHGHGFAKLGRNQHICDWASAQVVDGLPMRPGMWSTSRPRMATRGQDRTEKFLP